MELLPSGERAPEQLRRVPCREGHLGGAAQRRRPDAPGPDDGPGGRRPQPPQEQAVEAQPERVPAQASPRLTVRLASAATKSCPGAVVSAWWAFTGWESRAGNPAQISAQTVGKGRTGPLSKQVCLSLPGNQSVLYTYWGSGKPSEKGVPFLQGSSPPAEILCQGL